jgi:hypothetical protein
MKTTDPMNQKIKALAVQATEIKQASDHCSGQSETWSEVNLDTFARILVQECVGVIEQSSVGSEQGLFSVEALKVALRAHFGLQ